MISVNGAEMQRKQRFMCCGHAASSTWYGQILSGILDKLQVWKPRKQGALCDGHMGNLALAKPSSKQESLLHFGLAYVAGKRETG